MGYPLILSPHISDAGTVTGAATPGSMGLGNLQEPQPTDITRFSSLTGMYWEWDLLSAQEIAYIWLGFSNATSAATVRHRGATSQANLTASPGYDSGVISFWPAGAALSSYARVHHHHNLLAAHKTFRWWRADFVDAANPLGALNIGRGYYVPATALWQASRGSGWGASIGPQEEVRRIFSEGGQTFPRKRPRTNPIEIPFNGVPEAEALGIVNELGRLRGVSQDVVAIIDPDKTAYLQQLTAYGVMSAPLKQSNPRYGRWQTVTVAIEEMS